MASTAKKRFAAVGTGVRVPMYIDAIARDHSSDSEVVALCDQSLIRARYHQERLAKVYGYERVPIYGEDQFEAMIHETKPDAVIVCTVDATHHLYINRALELGCDVVTEKPITVDAGKCRSIFETVERTGGKVQVAFNYRWAAAPTRLKQLVLEGTIGRVKSVQLNYALNTAHGADYFRRWHATKALSGGLLVHKSTHHFDLVNWLIDGIPEQVMGYGALSYYGEENALARGENHLTGYGRYAEIADTEKAAKDPFFFSVREGNREHLYRAAEAETGYIRDQNVFRPGIDIEDNMGVLVRYRDGALLTYSLTAFSAWEGFQLSLVGDNGRIDYRSAIRPHVLEDGEAVDNRESDLKGVGEEIMVTPLFRRSYTAPIEQLEGGHGGGDPRLQAQIFQAAPPEEHLGRLAGHEQGAASALIGFAANLSIAENRPVNIGELLTLQPEAAHLHQLV